jgi:hypothetical protein
VQLFASQVHALIPWAQNKKQRTQPLGTAVNLPCRHAAVPPQHPWDMGTEHDGLQQTQDNRQVLVCGCSASTGWAVADSGSSCRSSACNRRQQEYAAACHQQVSSDGSSSSCVIRTRVTDLGTAPTTCLGVCAACAARTYACPCAVVLHACVHMLGCP